MKSRTALTPTLGAATVAGALAWTLVAQVQPFAAAAEPVSETEPGYAVEDFNYPRVSEI